ncbi:hypothetical protein F0L68_17070 [Solihabitans fulvus]|uniref:Excreted virulence factor EspC, type VII ESX diderm n=1 Tax=Solihabitans fulvus TaxID=1892852 RepID=A0A5B2XCK4_9PSEU|nr:hypothetical protein [Solihabitans fulvus]KAA2261488.1 hypothetical protein F0L68_17070 [Solihabitans fulvus]
MSPTPNGKQVAVALDALRSDATTWDNAAADLTGGPRTTIGSLHLTPDDVSKWAADHGLDATYNDARTKLEDIIKQAADNLHAVGTALRASADVYQRDEDANLHRLNGIY